MHSSITPVNITAAALIAQFCLLGIMLAAAIVLRLGEQNSAFWREGPNATAFPWYIAVAALLTLAALLFTDQMSNLWKPLLGDSGWIGLKWSTGILVAFSINAALLTLLVSSTGGSAVSPFNPIYFLLPVLAIFLREPLPRIIFYVVGVATLFSATFFMHNEAANSVGGQYRRGAYWFVSIACFALATYIGVITRSR